MASSRPGQELYDSGKTSEDAEWTALIDDQRLRPDERSRPARTPTMDDVGDTYMTLHWQPNSIYSDSVNFGEIRIWAGETEATTPLVLSGEIGHATNVYPPSTLEAFAAAGINTVAIPRGYGPALLFQHDTYPWNITEVRQASALVIDREENAFLTNGLGATATVYMAGLADSMVPLWMTQEAIDQLDRYEFDPDRAAELLQSVGFEKNADGKWADADGNVIAAEFKFPAEFTDFSGMALNATEQLNEFGFDITARAIPWQQCADDIRNGDFELSVWSWSSQSPFPARQFYGPLQRFNYVGLTQGQKGMNFPMEFEWKGEQINLRPDDQRLQRRARHRETDRDFQRGRPDHQPVDAVRAAQRADQRRAVQHRPDRRPACPGRSDSPEPVQHRSLCPLLAADGRVQSEISQTFRTGWAGEISRPV